MTKKGKIILAVSVSLAVVIAGAFISGAVLCRKIFRRRYISVN